MSASPFLSHFSNPITPFPHNHTKISSKIVSNCTKIEGIRRSTDSNITKSSEPNSNSSSVIKAPTAPWMNEPLLVKPSEILDFKKRKTRKDSTFGKNVEQHPDTALTGKVGGGRGKVAMKKIFKGIEKLGENQNLEETRKNPENVKFKFAPGDLWGNGVYQKTQNSDLAEESWGNSEFDVPLGEIESEGKLKRMPWDRDERTVVRRVRKEKAVTVAESSLDGILLERLRCEAATIKKWVKVKKLGVTQDVVDQVRMIWRDNELALIKFDVPLCRNMDRAREIVELKTQGIVVWSNKDFHAVYRGCNYFSGSKHIWKRETNSTSDQETSSSTINYQNTRVSLDMPSLYEREADRLLDGLGPRFVDWWMSKPLPVDADLLPELVKGLNTPLRLCPPYYTKSKLTDAELTHLRKLARPLPTHFVLGIFLFLLSWF